MKRYIGIAIAIIMITVAYAQDWQEASNIFASDRSVDDWFGADVAISGDYAIVGASGEQADANGENILSDAGAAYIFYNNGTSWSQQQKLVASDRLANAYFGYSVDMSGDYVVIGADSHNGKGSAYIFKRSGTSWSEQQIDIPTDLSEGNSFGKSVAIDGDYVIVGAPNKNEWDGAAYVFVRNGETWAQQAILTPPVSELRGNFGYDVDICGADAIVGAWLESDDKGAAYVFSRSGTTWSQQQQLLASDAADYDQFGCSVGIDADYAVVGAVYACIESWDDESCEGAAYIFNRSGTTWSQQQKLIASDYDVEDYFGESVAIDGDFVIIAADYEDEDADGNNTLADAGSAYIFQRSESTWTEQQKIVASNRASGDEFGRSVAITGSLIIIGAGLADTQPGPVSNAGYAYIFENTSDNSLPVELASFSAMASGSNIILKWRTESEFENLGFLLSKKEKGKSTEYETIANYQTDETLEGHGSTTEKHDYQYTDKSVQPGVVYEYRLADVDYQGTVSWHSPIAAKVQTEDVKIVDEFGLQRIYPNPFNPTVTLNYGINQDTHTTLQVLNMRGQMVETLVNTHQSAGTYELLWQPENLSAGVYMVRLQSGNQINLQKIVFVK